MKNTFLKESRIVCMDSNKILQTCIVTYLKVASEGVDFPLKDDRTQGANQPIVSGGQLRELSLSRSACLSLVIPPLESLFRSLILTVAFVELSILSRFSLPDP